VAGALFNQFGHPRHPHRRRTPAIEGPRPSQRISGAPALRPTGAWGRSHLYWAAKSRNLPACGVARRGPTRRTFSNWATSLSPFLASNSFVASRRRSSSAARSRPLTKAKRLKCQSITRTTINDTLDSHIERLVKQTVFQPTNLLAPVEPANGTSTYSHPKHPHPEDQKFRYDQAALGSIGKITQASARLF